MTAQELKNSILQLAVQGKLVPQCKEDEPASELLKRIRADKEKVEKKEKPLPEITEDEIPFDIPESWEWVRLGEMVSVISGTSYKSSDVRTYGLRILRGGNIQESKVVFCADDVFLPETFFDEEKSIKNGDVLIVASTGSKTVIGKPGFVYQSNEKTQIGAFLRIVRPHSQQMYDFIRVIFNSEFYRNHIRTKVQGMNINNVRSEHITEFLVPIPPLAEQKRIVAKIEELMPMVEEYGKAEEQLTKLNAEFPEKLRKSILQQAVQGKLTERDPADEPASELLKRIKTEKEALMKSGKIKKEKPLPEITEDEKPFDIPDTWEWVRFTDIMMVISTGPFGSMLHKSDYVIKGIPLVNPANIINGKIVASEKMMVSSKIAETLSAYKLYQGMIVMGRRGEMGRCAEVTEHENEWLCGTGSFFMQPSKLLFVPYLISFFSSPYAKGYLGGVSVGSTMSNLNHDLLKRIPVPLPPLAEQKRIVKRVEELLALCDELK